MTATNTSYMYFTQHNRFMQRSIQTTKDIDNNSTKYYFKNKKELLNLLKQLLVDNSNIPIEICLLINDYTFEKRKEFIFGGSRDNETSLVSMECNYNENNKNDSHCVVFKIIENCNLKDVNVKMSRGLHSFYIDNHCEYGECIIMINMHKDIGDIGYNVYLFDQKRWLFLKNRVGIFETRFATHGAMILFNNNLLIVSWMHKLLFYNLFDLNNPIFIGQNIIHKHSVYQLAISYWNHQMQCIKTENNSIELLLFGGRMHGGTIANSFTSVKICSENNFDITNINENNFDENFFILDEDISVKSPQYLTNTLHSLALISTSDIILNENKDIIVVFVNDTIDYICMFNYSSKELSIINQHTVCFVFLIYL